MLLIVILTHIVGVYKYQSSNIFAFEVVILKMMTLVIDASFASILNRSTNAPH